jgi:hypothetical protein
VVIIVYSCFGGAVNILSVRNSQTPYPVCQTLPRPLRLYRGGANGGGSLPKTVKFADAASRRSSANPDEVDAAKSPAPVPVMNVQCMSSSVSNRLSGLLLLDQHSSSEVSSPVSISSKSVLSKGMSGQMLMN